MKINSDQKSVLTLAGFVFFGVLLSGPENFLNKTEIIIWIILALWFYGVRDKKKNPDKTKPQ